MITLKIVKGLLIIVLSICFVNVAFWLMNKASTVAFILGIICLVMAVGFPIEFVINLYNKNRYKKELNN
jgi:hypothetical protein